MNPRRRLWLLQLAALPFAALPLAAVAQTVRRGQALAFPRDHGAHLKARTEWWYATGWLGSASTPSHGFQITFFRSRTGLAADNPSRFAARHLLFAHAAVTQLADSRHVHGQRIERWNGQPGNRLGHADENRGAVALAGWSLQDTGSAWVASAPGRDIGLQLTLARTQPLLLQGDGGHSRKGPLEQHASHYLSEPQLAASGSLTVQGKTTSSADSSADSSTSGSTNSSANSSANSSTNSNTNSNPSGNNTGRAWLDHEWSDEYLAPGAVGWDWIGFNLFDGSALTAFVLRRADGSALWAGGSFRRAGENARSFAPEAVRFTPGRRWRSPASGALYPVLWTVDTPAGRYTVQSLLDAQELDSRSSTGTIYWEGLSELLDAGGRRVGLGYLEMTGYAGVLKL